MNLRAAHSLIVAVMLALALSIAMLAAAAPASARVTATPSTLAPTADRAFRITGRVSGGRRSIVAQHRSAGTWKDFARARSHRDGKFKLSVKLRTSGTTRVRIYARKTNNADAEASRSRQIDVLAKGRFRAVYAVTAGETPDPDKVAAIRNVLSAVGLWFSTQTSGLAEPRWVRDGSGNIAVTTVTLPQSAIFYSAQPDIYGTVVNTVNVLSRQPFNQKTLVWSSVADPTSCGMTGDDYTLFFEGSCDIKPSAYDIWPLGGTYIVAHEMAHAFGAVNRCAPHEDGTGHVSDDPRDLLYSGPLDRNWIQLALDPGHDDYYGTHNRNCPGIEMSPYWANADGG